MIRKTLTTLFCAALFFLLVFVIPAQAEHPASAPYFCTTMESAMETVRLQRAEQMDAIRDKAMSKADFKCWFNDFDVPFYPTELVYEYTAFNGPRGMFRALAPDGTEVFLFGTMEFIDHILHQQGT